MNDYNTQSQKPSSQTYTVRMDNMQQVIFTPTLKHVL